MSKTALSSPLDGIALTQRVLRRRLLVQLTAFIFLELAFIALAVICLRTPLPISFSSSLTLPKAIFTVAFIVWQTVAIMCAQSVVAHGFSSEWYIRFRQTGRLIPGHTDMVSTATAGYLDRFRYFFGRSCSLSFRLSFLTSLILIALAGLAPGSINVEDVQRFQPSTIPITNFTTVGGDIDGILKNPIFRTGLIIELELRDNTTFKFNTEEHVIAGWPNIEAGQLTGDMRFQTDVLLYNMTCWWEAPSANISQWNTTWYAGGFAWYPWNTPVPKTSFEGGLMPLFRFTTDQEFFPDDFPDPLHAVDPVGLQGYVFFGRNSSLPKSSSKTRTLNLDGLPTTFNSSGFLNIDYDGADGHFRTPLATFLLCDPHARILDGEVLLSQKNTSITLISASPPANSRRRVGNIPPDAANVILGLSMMQALEVDDDEASMRLGVLASQAFTNDTSQDFERSRENPFDIGILPIEDIQRNLNLYMNSGGKSLSSYVKDFGIEGTEKLFLMPAQGAIQKGEQALVTSKGLMIATISLFFCAMVLCLINVLYLRVWQTPPFKLETLVHQLQRQNDEKSFSTSTSSLQDLPGSNRPTLRKLLMRLFGFIILELAFLLLVLFCTRKYILVNIPLSLAEVKGGFTVVFILWHTLATFLLSDAVSFAFSSEWSRQYVKTGHLVPGVTDRVSRLTSGNEDKTRYFLTSHPSITFRCAFLTFLISAALSSFAPGSLSVSKVTVLVSMPMKVADLRMVNSSQADDNDNQMTFLQDRANSLVELEHHDDTVFKYEMQPNWLMAWPDETTIDPSVIGNVDYPTDVVHFNYSCSWRVPEMGSDHGVTTWNVDGHKWKLYGDVVSDFPYVGGVVMLYRYVDVQPDAILAILVVGTNDSLPVDPEQKRRSIVNLNNLPTLFHPHGLTLNDSDGVTSTWISPLSTILVCDPRLEVSGGRARLSPSKQLSVVASQLPAVGNMPYNSITTLFSEAITDALDTDDNTINRWISVLSARVFLTDSSENFAAYPHGVPVFDLPTLSNNLNIDTLSGSKAFLDGLFVGTSDLSNISSLARPVIGLGEVEKEALVGDKTLGIVALGLSIGTLLSFSILAYLILVNVGRTFELKYLLPILCIKPNDSFVHMGSE